MIQLKINPLILVVRLTQHPGSFEFQDLPSTIYSSSGNDSDTNLKNPPPPPELNWNWIIPSQNEQLYHVQYPMTGKKKPQLD